MKAKCTKTVNHPLVVFQEARSKLIIKNAQRKDVKKIIVDGCQITKGIRCDHLMISDEVEHFIELKGQDIKHALEQLKATMSALSANINKTKISFVICTRSPISSASIQSFQVHFRKHYNCKLIIKSSPFTYSI